MYSSIFFLTLGQRNAINCMYVKDYGKQRIPPEAECCKEKKGRFYTGESGGHNNEINAE